MKHTVTLLFLFMASFIVSAIEQADFNRMLGEIRQIEQKGDAVQAAGKYKEFLKTDDLTDAQKCSIYERLIVTSLAVKYLKDATEDVKAAWAKEYQDAVKQFLALPDSPAKQGALNNLINHCANFSRQYRFEGDYEMARSLFESAGKTLSEAQQVNILRGLASHELNILDEPGRFAATFAAIKAYPPSPDRTNKMIDLTLDSARLLPENGEKLIAEVEKDADDAQKIRLYQEMALISMDWKDRAAFEKYFGKIKAMPFSNQKFSSMVHIANRVRGNDEEYALNILKELYKMSDLTPQQKFNIIDVEIHFYDGSIRGYGGQDYAQQKNLRKEFEKLLATGELKNTNANANFMNKVYRAALWACDYEGAYSAIQEAVKMNPGATQFALAAAELALYFNDVPAALNYYKSIVDNEKANQGHRRIAQISMLIAEKKPYSEVEKAVAGMELSPNDQLRLLYDVSESLFKTKRYDDVRKLNAEIDKRYRPTPKKEYIARYVEDAPASADTWARSSLLKDSKYKETRFDRYGDNIPHKTFEQETKRLKTAEITPVPSEYETAFYMVYNEDGVHMYIHCKNPDANTKVKQGFANGDSLEMLLRPGGEAAYHSWFFERLPSTGDSQAVVWDAPHKQYRLTYDFFRKDSTVTKDALGAYTFIPWTMFYDKLPVAGQEEWIVNCQRWGAHSVTLGGAVHDMGPALHVKFDMPAQVLTKIKRSVALQQYAKYKKLRNDAGAFILTWNDELLGDPDFFKAVLEPLLKELDENGEKLLDAPDNQINAIYEKYVPQWAEITFVVADKRKEYLKKALLSE